MNMIIWKTRLFIYIYWIHPSSTPSKLAPQPILVCQNSISFYVYSILVQQFIICLDKEHHSDVL